MRSRIISLFAAWPPTDGVKKRLAGSGFLISGVADGDPKRSGIGDRLSGLSGEGPQPGQPISRRPLRDYSRQLSFWSAFNVAC